MGDMKLGFVGLGIMGKPMAENLLAAGYSVTAYTRTTSKLDDLAEKGGAKAGSAAEAAAASDVTITMLPDSPDVELVALGEGGVLEGARPGSVYVDMSTISPAVAGKVAEAAAERGVDALDAPVSGGDRGAKEGTLSIMVGGKEEALDRVRPVLEVMGGRITYMGPPGSGQATKLCNQAICVLNILAACEGLMLGAASGLDLDRLLEAVTGGAAGSWMLSNLGPKMAARDFAPGFFVRLQQKDLRLVMETARDLNLPMPGTALVHQLFAAIEAEGGGEDGTQALVRALEKLAGRKLGAAS